MTEEGFALAAEETLADERLVHQPKQRNAVMRQADESAPKRLADDEGAGAVDRIDDPAILGVAAHRAELLADYAVRGMELCEGLPDRYFRTAVGDGHRIEQIASFMVNRAA